MATLEGWFALDLDEEERMIVDTFYGLRPEWLDKGDISKYALVSFDPVVPAVEPLEVSLDECSPFWGGWHTHCYGWDGSIQKAVDYVEAILDERLVRVIAYTADGAWCYSELCSPQGFGGSALPNPAESSVWSPRVSRAPWDDVRRPARLVITSWRNTYSREIILENR